MDWKLNMKIKSNYQQSSQKVGFYKYFCVIIFIYKVEEDDLREEISSILTILQSSSSSQTTSSQSHQQDFDQPTNQSKTSG